MLLLRNVAFSTLADNFAALIYLSDRLLLQNLRRELERLTNEKESAILDTENVAMSSLVDILIEASQAGLFFL